MGDGCSAKTARKGSSIVTDTLALARALSPCDPAPNIRGRGRRRDEVALGRVAAEIAETLKYDRVLDTFGHNREPKVVRHVDRRTHDRIVSDGQRTRKRTDRK